MALPQTVPYLGWSLGRPGFLVLAGVLLGSSLMVVLSRNIIRSGLFMILAFAGPRGHLRADGCDRSWRPPQVLIYIGAISVLILFAVMLTQSKSGPGAPGVPLTRRGPRASRR